MDKRKDVNIGDYIIDTELPLAQAVEQMAGNQHKGLVAVKDGRVYGVFTRRDLVRCCHIFSLKNIRVQEFVNRKYDSCLYRLTPEARRLEHAIIPIVDEDNRLLDIYFPPHPLHPKYHYPVAIMAGGLGTRLYPYTKDIPKPLVTVVDDTPMVKLIMDAFHKYNADEFSMIVNHKKEMIIDYFHNHKPDYHIHYYKEDRPLGTGGGLKLLQGDINETFFLTNCDALVVENYDEIYEYHKKAGNMITIISAIKSIKVPYGVISVDQEQQLLNTTEKPTYMILVNTGVYVVEPGVLDYIAASEPVDFPTIVDRVKEGGHKVGIYPITEDKWLDMGQIDELNHTIEYLTGTKEGVL